MRKITVPTASLGILCSLLFCSLAVAGDRSNLEPRSSASGSASFSPPITQAGMSPVVKAFQTDLWHCDFVTPLALTASVVGDNVVISVPGVATRTIDWTVTSGI